MHERREGSWRAKPSACRSVWDIFLVGIRGLGAIHVHVHVVRERHAGSHAVGGRRNSEATHVVAYGARVETCGYIIGWYTRPWGYTCDQRAACAAERGRGAIHAVAYDARERCLGPQ